MSLDEDFLLLVPHFEELVLEVSGGKIIFEVLLIAHIALFLQDLLLLLSHRLLALYQFLQLPDFIHHLVQFLHYQTLFLLKQLHLLFIFGHAQTLHLLALQFELIFEFAHQFLAQHIRLHVLHIVFDQSLLDEVGFPQCVF